VEARNQADNLIHATRKSMKDLDGKMDEAEKRELESAVEALEAAIKSDDKDRIEEKSQALAQLSGKLAERVYAAASEGRGAGAGGESRPQEDVVDAEFEEVKEDKK
jgi:molecular chaperone DnaK